MHLGDLIGSADAAVIGAGVVLEVVFAVFFLRHFSFAISALRSAPSDLSLDGVVRTLARAGVRVAFKDLTPDDVAANSSFRVVRALASGLQPLWFGGETPRLISPRLRRFAKNGLNPRPHPLA